MEQFNIHLEANWNAYHARSIPIFDARSSFHDYDLMSFCNSKKVLEIGCGKGQILNSLSDYQPYELHGCDISETALQTAKNLNGGRVSVFKSHPTMINMCANSMDTIILSKVFSSITKQRYLERFLSNVHDIISENGKIIIIDFAFDWKLKEAYKTIRLGNANHSLIHPSWSINPFIHYKVNDMIPMFDFSTLVRSEPVKLFSCNGNQYDGFLTVLGV